MTKLIKFGFFDDKTNPKLELSKLKRDAPHDMEKKILHYLNGGYKYAHVMGVVEDILAPPEIIMLGPDICTDGTWEWTSDVMYYVEKYHIQLPDDFLTHMAINNWQCPLLDNVDDLELDGFFENE
ncbi:MAG: hypothetical protein FWH27_02210 [Planctomycetaceae bacterium]|nr:hypothetical protein [Planctomycetaceae bacterium]